MVFVLLTVSGVTLSSSVNGSAAEAGITHIETIIATESSIDNMRLNFIFDCSFF